MTEQVIERPLPQFPDAERAVLAGVLMGAKSHAIVFDLIAAGDFFDSRHQRIFGAMAKMRADGAVIDLVTLTDQLHRNGELEAVDGPAYLAQLGEGVTSFANIEHHARIVKDKALKRDLIHTAHAIQQRALNDEDTAEVILDSAAELIGELVLRRISARQEGMTFQEAAVSLLRAFEQKKGVRIFTDVEELDRSLGGIRDGELAILTAETGVGKTLFAQQIRRRGCRDGHHSLYCSGEMSAPHLVSREIASEAGVRHWKMRQPERISKEEYASLVKRAAYECTKCRILDGELSLARIRAVARRMKAQTGLSLAVLDYDELIDAPGKDEFDQQRNLIRGAKSIAIELHCPVIVISQLRKALTGEDVKRPTLQRLYGSGAKAKHASIVIYVDREFVRELNGNETAARIAVVKNRDGKVGVIEAKFNVDTLRFESVSSDGLEVQQPGEGKAAGAGR
jgi:replicative DNA helicase